jgi:hypothetical protein
VRRITLSVAAAALAAAALAAPVSASAPTKTIETFEYTLADALADYVPGDELACGDYDIIATFAFTTTVTDFGDRMLRQVSYEGRYYNVSDLEKSAFRIGRTATWRTFDAEDNLETIAIHGMGDRAVLADGRSIVIGAGIRKIDFTTDPPTDSFVHGRVADDAGWQELCDALR